MRKVLLLISSVMIGLLNPQIVCANITLSQTIILFPADKRPIQTIEVINFDDERTFAVKTDVTEVLNPGTEQRSVINSKSLVVAPNAFEIAAQKKRNVRLLLRERNNSDIEKVYMITFTPESPSRAIVQKKNDKVEAKVDIIVGMGALILVPPKEIKYKLEAAREGKKLLFNNNSNISIELQPRNICITEDKCFRFNGKRLYPNVSWEYELPPEYEKIGLTLSVRAAGKYSAVEFSPID